MLQVERLVTLTLERHRGCFVITGYHSTLTAQSFASLLSKTNAFVSLNYERMGDYIIVQHNTSFM